LEPDVSAFVVEHGGKREKFWKVGGNNVKDVFTGDFRFH
jgi:hypothetical protein